MKNLNFKQLLPHLVAVAIFLALSFVYFYPVLEGYTLKMGDMQGVSGMKKELIDYDVTHDDQAIWTNSMFGGMPGYLIYFNKVNPVYSIHQLFYTIFKYPVTPLLIAFVGFYFLARVLKISSVMAILGGVAYGLATYNMLIIEAGHVTKVFATAFFPCMLGGIYMMYRGSNKYISFGIIAFFSALELMMNHIQMSYYFVFLLLVLMVAEFLRFKKSKLYKEFAFKTGLIAIAGLVGFLSNFTNYYFLYKFSKNTIRGKTELTISPDKSKDEKEKNNSSGLDRDYIVQWSYGKQETLNLAIPLAKGKNDLVNDYFDHLGKNDRSLAQSAYKAYQANGGRIFSGYWGNQPFTSGPNYVGAIMVFLALLYLLLIHNPLKWLLLGLSTLIIMLSWGKNLGGSVEHMWLTNFFIDYIPLYSKFRAVSSILVVINFVVPFMSVLFLKELIENNDWRNRNLKKIYFAGAGVIAVFVFIALSPTLFSDFLSNSEKGVFAKLNNLDLEESIIDFRINVFKTSAYRSILLMLVSFGLIVAFAKKYLKGNYTVIAIAVLVLFDLWSVDRQFLNNDKLPKNKRKYVKWEKVKGKTNRPSSVDADQQIFNLESELNPNLNTLVAQRLKDAKNRKKGRLTSLMKEDEKFAALNFSTNYRVLELDNPFNSSRASYFHKSTGGYSPAKLRRYQDMIDFYISDELSYLNTGALDKMKVLNMLNNKYYLYQGKLLGQNKFAFGNAWFVQNVKEVTNPDEEILAIKDVDVKNTAIINARFVSQMESKFDEDSSATIAMKSYLPNHIAYESNANKKQLAVFSEIYYEDGWNAYIDGKKVPHMRANYILRALPIPVGKHTIDFKFEPSGVFMGAVISVISFIIILISFLVGGYQKIKLNPTQ